MKRKIILVFTIFALLICLSGCSNPISNPTEDNTTYKIEYGYVSRSTYETVREYISNCSETNYSNIVSTRDYLVDNTIDGYGWETDITINQIKEYLLSNGFSNYETEEAIKFLKEVGNNIVFYGTNKSIVLWIYATK